MKRTMACCIALLVVTMATMAMAADTAYFGAAGYKIDGVGWTYTYTATEGDPGDCGLYCTPFFVNLNLCNVDGVYGQIRDPNSYYSYYGYYSTNGETWSTIDSENMGYTYVYGVWPNPGYYKLYGLEEAAYNNWDAPGNCADDPFVDLRHRYTSGGSLYKSRIIGPSCVCIE